MFQNHPMNQHTHGHTEEIHDLQEDVTLVASCNKKSYFQKNSPCINYVTIIITVFFCIVFFSGVKNWIPASQTAIDYTDLFPTRNLQLIEQRLPRILWIYTENQRDAQPIEDDIYLTYFANFAEKAKYQVRYVNSLSAYDYLSNQTIVNITNIMSKRTVDETVHSFLKLALLYENGGLMLQTGTILISDDFKWVQFMFDKYSQNFETNGCKPEQSHFYIHKNNDQYKAMIIAAVPRSPFFRQVFELLSEVVVSEEMKYFHSVSQKYNIQGLSWDLKHKVYNYGENYGESLSNFINHVLKKKLKNATQKCELGMQQPTSSLTIYMQKFQQPSGYQVLFSKDGFEKMISSKGLTKGKTVQAIGGLNQRRVTNTLVRFALGKYNRTSIIDTPMHKVLSVPGNHQILMEDLPRRQIQLCVVIMEGLSNEQLNHTSTLFNNQNYTNWKLIMPAKDINNAPKFLDKRILVIQKKSTKVHNIQKAVTKYCSHNGYAIVLNYNQTFQNQSAFHYIANAAEQRDVIGVYIPLQKNGKHQGVTQSYTQFYRIKDGIVNPKLDLMKHMINHFRVFSVQTFKTVPQFAMRDWNGKYLQDRLIFLMDFHDLIHVRVVDQYHLYTMKKNSHIWNMPRRVSILGDEALLKIQQFEQVNLQQLKITRTRVSSRNVKIILEDLYKYKIPFSKMAAFNQGEDFVPVEKKQGPQLIPKIIHQVWLGSKIPPAKQYFIQKTKKIYPDYELKIWRQHNITREIFPTTFDIIQNLLQFNKRSPYNKLATVTDIMRHQILYREGGLWKDAGMNMLRPIPESFLKYKLILPTDRLYQYRYLQGMCFFANMPKYQNMLRINNYRNLNKMRIFSSDPFNIAGPVDFRQLLVGQEEYDPNILLLPYQTFYPGQMGQHPQDDLCTTQKIKGKQKYQIVEGGWYLLPACEQKYPYAFAIEHNNYGSSWVGAQMFKFFS